MAKVAFSKLKCKINIEEKSIVFNDETIMVKQYLPIQEKLTLISYVVLWAHDQDYQFRNPVKTDVLQELEIISAYSNITFTDKQKEDLPKLYDTVKSSGLLDLILSAIPQEEIDIIAQGIRDTSMALYSYQNSVLGVLDTVKQNYDMANFDISTLQEDLLDPEALTLLKAILSKTN